MKPASLSGSILVPKGTAAPTNSPGAPASQAVRVAMATKLTGQGPSPGALPGPADAPRPPGPAEVARPQAPPQAPRPPLLQARPEPPREPLPAGVVGERVNLSFRLDADRHLRLKLAAAHLRKSSQRILELALDSYLERVAPHCAKGQCACLGDEETDGPDDDDDYSDVGDGD